MKRRVWTIFAALAGGLCLTGACASEGPPSAPLEPPDSGADAPTSDAGRGDADAGPCADCEYFPESCTPDLLCPNGLFDPSRPAGGEGVLDLRTQINTIVGRGPSDVWAAGAAGTLARFDGTAWKRSGPETQETFQGLRLFGDGELAFGSKLDRVFLRGLPGPDGGVAPSDQWSGLQSVATPDDYASVQAFSFTSVWAAAGSPWTWCGLATAEYSSSGVTGLWRVRQREGGSFEASPAFATCRFPCDSEGIVGIHGASANVVWAVGSKGAAFRVTDAESESPKSDAFNSLTWNRLEGVWAASDSEAWAVGVTGTIRHYRAGAQLAEAVAGMPTSIDLRAISGSSSSDIWAVGDAGVVLHYDGQTWSRVKIAGLGVRRPDLTAVWVPSPGHVWVGGQGIVLSLGGRP